MKVNGQWYVGPKEYGVGPERQMAFFWPSRTPARGEAAASEVAKRPGANPYGQLVEIFFRSEDKLIDANPQTPRTNALIPLAEANGWISERTTLRKGLDRITMKPVETPWGTRIDHVTYFVATELRGADGLPPVATCSKPDSGDGGGFGISWKQGVVVGTRMSQYHCSDFPEVYIEAVRVLNQLKKV